MNKEIDHRISHARRNISVPERTPVKKPDAISATIEEINAVFDDHYKKTAPRDTLGYFYETRDQIMREVEEQLAKHEHEHRHRTTVLQNIANYYSE